MLRIQVIKSVLLHALETCLAIHSCPADYLGTQTTMLPYPRENSPITTSKECTPTHKTQPTQLGHPVDPKNVVCPSTISCHYSQPCHFKRFLNTLLPHRIKHQKIALVKGRFKSFNNFGKSARRAPLLSKLDDAQVCFPTMFKYRIHICMKIYRLQRKIWKIRVSRRA